MEQYLYFLAPSFAEMEGLFFFFPIVLSSCVSHMDTSNTTEETSGCLCPCLSEAAGRH
jgi:hypothetical protein